MCVGNGEEDLYPCPPIPLEGQSQLWLEQSIFLILLVVGQLPRGSPAQLSPRSFRLRV